MKKILKKFFALTMCITLIMACASPKKVNATGMEVVVGYELGIVLWDFLITSLAVAGVSEIANDDKFKMECFDTFKKFVSGYDWNGGTSPAPLPDYDNPAYPAPAPAPDVIGPDSNIIRFPGSENPDAAEQPGSGTDSKPQVVPGKAVTVAELIQWLDKASSGSGFSPNTPGNKINFQVSAGFVGLVGDFVSQVASREIKNPDLMKPFESLGYNGLHKNGNGEYLYQNHVSCDFHRMIDGKYVWTHETFTAIYTSPTPLSYYKFYWDGEHHGYYGVNKDQHAVIMTDYITFIGCDSTVTINGVTTYTEHSDFDYWGRGGCYAFGISSAASRGEIKNIKFFTTAPIFDSIAESEAYLKTAVATDALNNQKVNKKELADNVANALKPLTETKPDTAVSTDTLQQIRNQIREKTEAQPELDTEAIKKAVDEAVRQAIEDTQIQVQPQPQPEPNPAPQPQPSPDTGLDVGESVGEGENIFKWLPQWLQKILKAILDIYNLIKGWLTLDIPLVKAEILAVGGVVPLVPLVQQLTAISDFFKGVTFSDSYTYPKITVATPRALQPYYKASVIVLVDFADFAVHLIWVRTILKVVLYIGMGFWVMKEFSVRFHVA